MKKLIVLAAALALTLSLPSQGQDQPSAKAEFEPIFKKVQEKLQAGKSTRADLEEEIKAMDQLLEKHKGQTNEEVAHVQFMKAMLFHQVLKDEKAAEAELEKVKKNFPGSEVASTAEGLLAQYKMKVGSPFPDFTATDLNGKPVSLADYKGKVLLIDFWATWCGPCVAELPHIQEAYKKHHSKGFEILGISLDREQPKLESFIKEKKMSWRQVFDGKEQKLATQYGIQSIPATFLLDGQGQIIGKDLRGSALEEAVVKALKK